MGQNPNTSNEDNLPKQPDRIYAEIASETCASSPTGKHELDGVGPTDGGIMTHCRFCEKSWFLD